MSIQNLKNLSVDLGSSDQVIKSWYTQLPYLTFKQVEIVGSLGKASTCEWFNRRQLDSNTVKVKSLSPGWVNLEDK